MIRSPVLDQALHRITGGRRTRDPGRRAAEPVADTGGSLDFARGQMILSRRDYVA